MLSDLLLPFESARTPTAKSCLGNNGLKLFEPFKIIITPAQHPKQIVFYFKLSCLMLIQFRLFSSILNPVDPFWALWYLQLFSQTPFQNHKNICANIFNKMNHRHDLSCQNLHILRDVCEKSMPPLGPVLSLESSQGGPLKRQWASRWGCVNKFANR